MWANRMKKIVSAFLTTLIAASLLSFVSTSTAAAASNTASFDFASCVQNSKSGSVMLLMDESGTIYGTGNKKASDPKNYRLTASKIMLDKLQRVSDVYKAPINLMLAGFGDQFKERSNGWIKIEPSKPENAISQLDSIAKNWETRATDGNSKETDVYSGFEGAQRAFAQETNCKLMVLFKDGNDWQSFDRDVKTSVSNSEAQALLEKGDRKGAAEVAAEEICRPAGLADGFRGSNIYVLSVALGASDGTSDFNDLRNFTEGKNDCGDLPGYGKLLIVPDAAELPAKFSQVLDPSFVPNSKKNSFQFNMTNALSSIAITTTGDLGAFDAYTITPPPSCSNGKRVFSPADGSTQETAQGVAWNSKWFSDDTFKITITKVDEESDDCWVGKWLVQPTGSKSGNSNSILEFDANLEAFADFGETNFFMTPDGKSKNFTTILRRVDTSSKVEPGELDPSLSLKVSAQFIAPDGKVVENLMSNVSKNDLAISRELTAKKDLPLGTYRVVLMLEASVAGLGVDLRPVRTEQTVVVRNAFAAPKATSALNFGDIDGSKVVEREFEFQQSPDAEFKFDFSSEDSFVDARQHPKDLNYKFVESSKGSSFIIPKGTGTTKVTIAFQVDGKGSVNKQGLVSGNLIVKAIPVGSESNAELISIPFTANQKADVAEGLRWLFILLFTLLGLAITLGALQLVGWLIAKFPTQRDIAERNIEALSISGTIQGDTFVSNGPNGLSQVTNPSAWHAGVAVDSSRRTAIVSTYSILAKSPGWRLGSPGFGVISAGNLVGWGSGLDSADGDAESARTGSPVVSLNLQRNWMVLIDRSALPSQSNLNDANTSIPAEIIFIIGAAAGGPASLDGGFSSSSNNSADKDRMLNELQSSIPLQLPHLISKFSGSRDVSSSKSGMFAKKAKPEQIQNSGQEFFSFDSKDPNDPFA